MRIVATCRVSHRPKDDIRKPQFVAISRTPKQSFAGNTRSMPRDEFVFLGFAFPTATATAGRVVDSRNIRTLAAQFVTLRLPRQLPIQQTNHHRASNETGSLVFAHSLTIESFTNARSRISVVV